MFPCRGGGTDTEKTQVKVTKASKKDEMKRKRGGWIIDRKC